MGTGERIKELRIKNNLSQEELGAKLGVQKSAIAKYESGRVENIKRSTIENLASIFGVSPIYIMCWEDYSAAAKNQTRYNDVILKYAEKLSEMPERQRKNFLNIIGDVTANAPEKNIRIESTRRTVIEHDDPIYIPDDTELRAAHEIPGASEEDKQHDYDIMRDPEQWK